MGDHQVRRFGEVSDGNQVDPLAGDHLGRDAGDARDLGRDRNARLAQRRKGADDIADPGLVIGEGDHAQLDDLVRAVVEPRGLCVEDQADALAVSHGRDRVRDRHGVRSAGTPDRPRLELAQDAVASRGFQAVRHFVVGQLWRDQTRASRTALRGFSSRGRGHAAYSVRFEAGEQIDLRHRAERIPAHGIIAIVPADKAGTARMREVSADRSMVADPTAAERCVEDRSDRCAVLLKT